MLLAQVMDDDGVLVLASAASMTARFASREFSYSFPEELVSAAVDEELCSWQTEEEGVVTIMVHAGEPPPPDAHFLGVLRIGERDDLLVLPYSQYTMACDHRHGEPEDIEGLCARMKVDPGRYACWARVAPVEGQPNIAEPRLAFDVYLSAAKPSDRPLRDVPTLGR